MELQRYFEEVTKCVMGKVFSAIHNSNDMFYEIFLKDENALEVALKSVSVDPGLNDLLPYFTQFVAQQVIYE